ncbi:protein involved in biosynthesis of mitomycin antibiotics/polyketide fumonisin [Paenibacillus marchantiophytorum]|uniref:Protein involved in biosynthesis of mitomycin antibiotics/polyketide fumonisin n=1 Tax=Paenibacillus marchantiophytorum TaxID=1619310 RepID=A0ABQ2BRY1_9BACL|nr:phytanoyl-CoA dioxygenase family protein [Paenibacillus marchantiophytorum]GGI44409.1 protein involved in biosynthesis of mitomycin antibiotics/polyketide fumonisin [Paenibacillus marchantiophytorum]
MITPKDVQFYKDNGYLLVKGVFNQQEVEEMRKAVEGIILRAVQSKADYNSAWQGDFLPPQELKKLVLKGFHDVHYHDASFMRAVIHPNMTAVLTQIIGPNVQLHHSKMLVKPPENGAAFPMHQDYPYFPHEKHTMLAASVHLDHADEENGCLRVISGSHQVGSLPHVGSYFLNHKEYPITEGTPCVAEAGDVLFFNYLTIHGSEVNRSTRTRRNVLFQYREASDFPTENTHFDWGMGLMVSGENPNFTKVKPDFKII